MVRTMDIQATMTILRYKINESKGMYEWNHQKRHKIKVNWSPPGGCKWTFFFIFPHQGVHTVPTLTKHCKQMLGLWETTVYSKSEIFTNVSYLEIQDFSSHLPRIPNADSSRLIPLFPRCCCLVLFPSSIICIKDFC